MAKNCLELRNLLKGHDPELWGERSHLSPQNHGEITVAVSSKETSSPCSLRLLSLPALSVTGYKLNKAGYDFGQQMLQRQL